MCYPKSTPVDPTADLLAKFLLLLFPQGIAPVAVPVFDGTGVAPGLRHRYVRQINDLPGLIAKTPRPLKKPAVLGC